MIQARTASVANKKNTPPTNKARVQVPRNTSKHSWTRWLPAEDEILTAAYPAFGSGEVKRQLPARSLASIKERARKLKLRAPPPAMCRDDSDVCMLDAVALQRRLHDVHISCELATQQIETLIEIQRALTSARNLRSEIRMAIMWQAGLALNEDAAFWAKRKHYSTMKWCKELIDVYSTLRPRHADS